MENKINVSRMKPQQIFTMDVEQDINAALDFARLLATYKIKGELYITGEMLEKYPTQVKQIAKFHMICAHGYNHEDFSKLSYNQAEQVIKKTVALFKKNKLKLKGWRFPGFKFKNSQLKLLVKYSLFDSSLRDKVLHRWRRLVFLRNFLVNVKRARLFMPVGFPAVLDERPWSIVDLNDSSLYIKHGRLVFHCYYYVKIKNEFEEYLKNNIQLEQ